MRDPATFREFLHARLTGRDPVARMGDKLAVKKLVLSLGFAAPETLGFFESADALDFRSLPDIFVLKPREMSTVKGVMLLHRIAGDQGFWDCIARKRRLEGDVVEKFRRLEAEWSRKRAKPFGILAEERLEGEDGGRMVPPDYKFYTFNGEIKLISQVERARRLPSFTFFGPDFSPWNWQDHIDINPEKASVGEDRVPSCAAEMSAVVEKLSRLLRNPFMRIDMYASKRGPVVGELSDTPGTGYYLNSTHRMRPHLDRAFGKAWADASRALGIALPQIGDEEVIPSPRPALPDQERPDRGENTAAAG